IDIGNTSWAWSTAEWQLTSPAGTTFQLRTRTSSDGTAWSGWSAPLTTTGQTISSPAGRYLQYLAEFATSDPSQSPVLDSVTMRYNSTSGALPTLSINDVSVTEGNSSNVAATFTVTLSAASSQTVTINY